MKDIPLMILLPKGKNQPKSFDILFCLKYKGTIPKEERCVASFMNGSCIAVTWVEQFSVFASHAYSPPNVDDGNLYKSQIFFPFLCMIIV